MDTKTSEYQAVSAIQRDPLLFRATVAVLRELGINGHIVGTCHILDKISLSEGGYRWAVLDLEDQVIMYDHRLDKVAQMFVYLESSQVVLDMLEGVDIPIVEDQQTEDQIVS